MNLSRAQLSLVALFAVCSILQAEHHESVDLVGKWTATASSDTGARDITWTFKRDGDKLLGVSLTHESGDVRDLDRITVKDKQVTLEVDIVRDGNKGVIRVVAEQSSPGKLTGKWSVIGDDGTEFLSGNVEAVKEVAFAGQWNVTSELPDGEELKSELRITGENSNLKGTLHTDNGRIDVNKLVATKSGLRCEFVYKVDGNSYDIAIDAKSTNENELAGKWSVTTGEADGRWTAVRKAVDRFAGEWDVTAAVADNPDYTGVLELHAENGSYTGSSKGRNNESRKLTKVTVNGDALTYTVPLDYQGVAGTIEVKAKLNDKGSLIGEWVLTGTDGTEHARNRWEAKRK